MAGVGSSNISFSGLRTAWNEVAFAGGSDPTASSSAVHPGIAISEFHGATFTSGDPIDANGAGDSVSIDTHFKDRTFGTADFIFYLQVTNDGSIMDGNEAFYVQIRSNSGDDVTSEEIAVGDAETLEIVDDSTPTSGITINFVDNLQNNLTGITLSDGMSGSITYTAPGSGGAAAITFGATGSESTPLTMGILAEA